MHERAMDACIEVIRETDTEVLGQWMGLGYTGNPWVCSTRTRPFIHTWISKSAKGWIDITDKINEPRRGSGPTWRK